MGSASIIYILPGKYSCFRAAALREKCPNGEFFLVLIFPYSHQKKTSYLDTFHAVLFLRSSLGVSRFLNKIPGALFKI